MNMTEKHVRDLTPQESAELLRTLKRGLPSDLPPLDVSVRAADMDESQRRAFIREVNRRWG
jgi:hypothetical protein